VTYDYLIIGSGFGGSVSALRLVEKGYRVLMLEQGQRFTSEDFPKTNWDLKRWLWMPKIGFRGLFKMTLFRHVMVFSGVGVGGGSLVYANTLPVPKDDFFSASSWSQLANWKLELEPHYATAKKMLGVVRNPVWTDADRILHEVASDLGLEKHHEATEVGVYFGEPGKTVADPFFGGQGPERGGCVACGGCMLGCRYNAKNTLDKNYLYLAEKLGLELESDTRVTWVRPHPAGYEVTVQRHRGFWQKRSVKYYARNVIFAGGVIGTVDLLLKLKNSPQGLPHLSNRVGDFLRTNSESLIGIFSKRDDLDMAQGVAITSILHTDAHSHLEPVRYPKGSGFFRMLGLPHVKMGHFVIRMLRLLGALLRHPLTLPYVWFVGDFGKKTMIMLYMRTLDGYLRLRPKRGWFSRYRGMRTELAEGEAPAASIPEASELAKRVSEKMHGLTMSMFNESLFNIPSTAHILGGCCMGESQATGVIDTQHRVFGYNGLYVIDGSAVSANPGVNPSLTICALAERAMTFIPQKDS
jgi:cholesterol oxidase